MKKIFILSGKADDIVYQLNKYKQHCLRYGFEPSMTNIVELGSLGAVEVQNG